MEDYMATGRNGHQLTDNFDPETNALDIRSNGECHNRDKKLYGTESRQNKLHAVFSHGKESGPFGRKIQGLMAVAEEMGLSTTSVDYRQCADTNKRVALLYQTLNQLDIPLSQIVLVGSSMGGYVSTVVANELPVAGLFLMAPALWMPAEEYTVQSYQPKTEHMEITHGFNDDIVPFENSLRFAKEHSGTTLHLVPDGHRLSASHQFLEYQFKRFLEEIVDK